jgi:diacylglycerol kinase
MAYLARMTDRRRLIRSFRFATRGIWISRPDPNFRIQLVSAGGVAFLTAAYGITGSHLGLVVISIAAVLSAELMNTAVERLCNFIAELHGIGRDPRIRDIKDIAAGSVLVMALGALANGIIVFGPHLMM